MSPELQTTLMWVAIFTAILIAASAFKGGAKLAKPAIAGGIGAALGALFGAAFSHPLIGAAICGSIGLSGFFIWFFYSEDKKKRHTQRRSAPGNGWGDYGDRGE